MSANPSPPQSEPLDDPILVKLAHSDGPFSDEETQIINWLANREIHRQRGVLASVSGRPASPPTPDGSNRSVTIPDYNREVTPEMDAAPLTPDSAPPATEEIMQTALTERELQLTIQAVQDAKQMNEVLRQGDSLEMDRIIEKLTAKTEASAQAYADNLNRKMSRSRGND